MLRLPPTHTYVHTHLSKNRLLARRYTPVTWRRETSKSSLHNTQTRANTHAAINGAAWHQIGPEVLPSAVLYAPSWSHTHIRSSHLWSWCTLSEDAACSTSTDAVIRRVINCGVPQGAAHWGRMCVIVCVIVCVLCLYLCEGQFKFYTLRTRTFGWLRTFMQSETFLEIKHTFLKGGRRIEKRQFRHILLCED